MIQSLIKELFSKATFDENGPYIPLQSSREPMRWSITDDQLEKFANSVLEECYSWAKENGGLSDDTDFAEMKRHFGVSQ
jgi:hypothetical protein